MSKTRLDELDQLIAELTIDAYGDDEQLTAPTCAVPAPSGYR
jgi:hypothetical protein